MRRLVVQMGHVARTRGATGTTGEQAFVRLAAFAVKAEMAVRTPDWEVRIIGADVPDHHYQGDAFVALHCDGSTSATARGASVGYRNNAGRDLGRAWIEAYERHGWSGFRSANYTDALASHYGVRNAVGEGNDRAFILEAGFLTNRDGASPTDRDRLLASDGPQRVARALVDAVTGTTASTPTKPTTPKQEDDMPGYGFTQEDDGQEVMAALQEVQRNTGRLASVLIADPQAPKFGKLMASQVRVETMIAKQAGLDPNQVAVELAGIIGPTLGDLVREALADVDGVDEQAIADQVVGGLAERLQA